MGPMRSRVGRSTAKLCLKKHQATDAIQAFEKIRGSAKEGLIFTLSTQYLAFLEYERGGIQLAYQLLKSVENDLSLDGMSLLHKTAFAEKDFSLVKKLGAQCFQNEPTVEIALMNASAHAELKEPEASIGWLETALREGLENISEVLGSTSFDSLKTDPLFVRWIDTHK